MSELRRDPIAGRWVIVSTDTPIKPEEYEHEEQHGWRPGACPFCYGNESLTPAEIVAVRDNHTPPNSPGWQVRVVPNKFPALQIEGDLERRPVGLYDMSNAIGAHEVIIETPYHHKDLSDLLDQEVTNILHMYRQRSLDLEKDRRFKYVMIFKNYGPSAGASLEHPHTQIIALPMVPKSVKEEIIGAQHYFEYRERCIFCDMIRQEMDEKERIVLENKNFIAFCPFVSRFPFEIWIMPKKHTSFFCETPFEAVPDLAVMLKGIIAKVRKVFGNPEYNFILHTSPINNPDSTNMDSYHWHLEFMPKLTRVAGFEWGTGFYLVPTPPESSAKLLREVTV
ncbi:MAG TPA: galactose-1-phosphate uridylyltransferase [Candidatus Omnitrophota bacterium]|jgi:UDPglucose--hexose-1-phosphate uridylyltransferase|nr:galactose-1-phosphate uridylyltransferase [Candidatus Omnitrophota bacterium]HRZ15189.1 galactose-1-phosphate uridylyltransferase [Candidatus Omnitrophota bacterium]